MSDTVEFRDFKTSDEYEGQLGAALALHQEETVATESVSSFKVLARPSGYWNNTGIYKPKGVELKIAYHGGKWRSNSHWGPTDGAGDGRYLGHGDYLALGVPEGSLIGKVGGANTGGGSHTFPIGNFGYVPLGLEGLLWLTVNDQPSGFGDNTGYIWVTVS
jgi:hypothetical protein